MRLCVAGSRTWTDADAVHEYLQVAQPTELIVGDCPTGADAIATAWARARSIPLTINYAVWKLEGRAAGPKRNARMLAYDRPELVVVFRSNGMSPGSDDMIRRCKALGIPHEVIRPKELEPTTRISAPRRA